MRRFVAMLLLFVAAALFLSGTSHTATQAQTAERCFEETGYCISGRIRQFWEQNGGLSIFGLPITAQRPEQVGNQIRQVQWFERNRLELHPENNPPYDVLLGRLGVDLLAMQGRDWRSFPARPPQPGCRYFSETGHNICDDILLAWRASGLELDGVAGKSQEESIALFGLPLSEAQREVLSDGNEYIVQWFERARFELHGEVGQFPVVLLGRLGQEVYAAAPRRIVIELTPETPGPTSTPGAATPTPVSSTPGVTTPSPSAAPARTPPPVRGDNTGRIAFVSDRAGNDDIYVMQADGTSVVSLTSSLADELQPAWSPDGSQIAFVSNEAGNSDIFVMNDDGSGTRRLSSHPGDDRQPAWSPDGSQIVFTSERGSNTDIYLITLDSSTGTPARRLTSSPGVDEAPVWSPDGTQIAFASDRDSGNWEVYVMNTNGSDQVNITTAADDDRDPAWSPDGERLAFVSNRSGDWEIYLMNADGSEQTNFSDSPDDEGAPIWSPDGGQIAFHSQVFVAGQSPNFDIYSINLDGSEQTNLTDHPARDMQPAWTKE